MITTSMLRLPLLGVLSACLLPSTAGWAQETSIDWSSRAGESSVTYHIVHKLHRVDGISKKVEVRARASAAGRLQVMLRIPSDSFDSGNVNRDAHTKEVLEAQRFPFVEVRALVEGVPPQSVFPATIERTVRGHVTLHGVTRDVDISIIAIYESATRLRIAAKANLSLDEFKVARPSLLFVKVDDSLKIDAALVLESSTR